jgi:ectoine hydroxylase-related dioxygenase (phytanoyl-CoA dioxygenase family)
MSPLAVQEPLRPEPLRPEPLRLNEAQLRDFARDGFIAITALTDQAEVLALRGHYDELFDRAAGFAAGDRLELIAAGERSVLPQIINPERYVPQLIQGRAFRNAYSLARQLLGEPCEPMGNHAILKPAGHGAATPWHQDEAYWDPRYAHRAVSIWMPLQPATLANGCMQFIPGSHRGSVLVHELIAPDSHGLRLAQRHDPEPARACELSAGGACIHDGRTLHYAGPNPTDEARRALVFGFRVPPTRLRSPMNYPWQQQEWFSDAS